MDVQALQSNYFIISLIATFALVFFWVSFSLKEFLSHYYTGRDKHKVRHLKNLEEYREELNRRRNF